MTNILSTKEIIHRATLGIPKEMKKKEITISSAVRAEFWIRSENITSKEHKTENRWTPCIYSNLQIRNFVALNPYE